MAVTVVTFRKGGTRATMTTATQKLKAAWLNNGADNVLLDVVMAGPDTGNWTVTLVYGDWNAFGKAMQSASADPSVAEAIKELDAVSELVARRLMGGVEL